MHDWHDSRFSRATSTQGSIRLQVHTSRRALPQTYAGPGNPAHLEQEERQGNAGDDTELADQDTAVAWSSFGSNVTHVPTQQAAHGCSAQEQGHQPCGSCVRHAQQLHVEGQKHQRIPRSGSQNALHKQ